jgi:NNP family nitrate/nitrite transporter-like MFS transporter
MNDITGVWTSCFMLLFALVATALAWMHFAIQRMEKKRVPALAGPRDLPELEVLGKPAPVGARAQARHAHHAHSPALRSAG